MDCSVSDGVTFFRDFRTLGVRVPVFFPVALALVASAVDDASLEEVLRRFAEVALPSGRLSTRSSIRY